MFRAVRAMKLSSHNFGANKIYEPTLPQSLGNNSQKPKAKEPKARRQKPESRIQKPNSQKPFQKPGKQEKITNKKKRKK